MKNNRNISQEEWNALARKFFGNTDADDEKGFEDELKNLDEADLAEIKKTAEQVDLHFNLQKFDSLAAYQSVQAKLKSEPEKAVKKLTIPYWLRIAAVVVLAVLIGSAWYFSGSERLISHRSSEVSVNGFGVSRVELPDGTLVTLNRDTKISYPDKFAEDVREVIIEGEAFFEVTPNPEKPFIIHAGDASIKVLGTSFNVNAYPESERVEVVVETGKVQVYNEKAKRLPENNLILDPGDKGIFVHASKELLKMPNQDPNFMAWRTRHLIFRETSLKEVIAQLNKLYRIQITTTDPGIEDLRYSGHFENQSVDFILEVISLTLEIEVDKNSEGYLLKKES